MDKMKKIYIGIICVISVIVIMLVALLVLLRSDKFYSNITSDVKDTNPYDKVVNEINQIEPTDIYLYGEDMYCIDSITYIKIDKLSEEKFTGKNNKKILIINDMSGILSLSEDEWKFLEEKAKSDFNFYFFYAGRNLLSEFEKRKIITENSPDDLCSGVVTYEGKRTGWTAYTKEDRKVANKNNRYELLGQSIFDVVRLCYESK